MLRSFINIKFKKKKMKLTIKSILLFFIAFNIQNATQAQGIKMPQPSTAQTITQDFGLGKVTLSYNRPNTKGRVIFGGLEPFDAVWRTGANWATVIKFTDDVKIEGVAVPAGEYSLFTIPNKTEWTFILNKTAKQWGAGDYKVADDILRVKVKPMAMKDKMETFTMQFANVMPTTAQLHIMWDNTAVAINITTSIDAKVMANIDEVMKGEKKPYLAAVKYYFENDKDLKTALDWINSAEIADQKSANVKLWKGRVQLKMGDKAGAKSSAEAGLALAKEAKNEDAIRLIAALLADAKK